MALFHAGRAVLRPESDEWGRARERGRSVGIEAHDMAEDAGSSCLFVADVARRSAELSAQFMS